MLHDFPALDSELDEQGATAIRLDLCATMLRVDILRGRDPGAAQLAWVERAARHTEAGESLCAGLGTVAVLRLMLGDAATARRLLAELVAHDDLGTFWWFALLPTLVRCAIRMGDLDLATEIHGHGPPQPVPSALNAVAAGNAALLEARGDSAAATDAYADAVRRWETMEVIPELAFALLGHGRSLLALRRWDEAGSSLDRARSIFSELQAVPALSEVDTAIATLAGERVRD